MTVTTGGANVRVAFVFFCFAFDLVFGHAVLVQMFANVQKTQELWMWKMEYLHHEQRPLYFGEWF